MQLYVQKDDNLGFPQLVKSPWRQDRPQKSINKLRENAIL